MLPLVVALTLSAPPPLAFTLEWQVLDHGLDTNTTTETLTVQAGHVTYAWHHTGYQADRSPRTHHHKGKVTDEAQLKALLDAFLATPACPHAATTSEDDVVRARYSLYACLTRGKDKKGKLRCYEGDLVNPGCEELVALEKLKAALLAQAEVKPPEAPKKK